MKLTLPEPPSANRYWRHAKGRTYLSADAKQYRDDVAAVCLKKGMKPLTGPIALTYAWYRGIRSGDLDNRSKQLLDALRGCAYGDDSQIVELHAYRFDRPGKPGVDVTVLTADSF